MFLHIWPTYSSFHSQTHTLTKCVYVVLQCLTAHTHTHTNTHTHTHTHTNTHTHTQPEYIQLCKTLYTLLQTNSNSSRQLEKSLKTSSRLANTTQSRSPKVPRSLPPLLLPSLSLAHNTLHLLLLLPPPLGSCCCMSLSPSLSARNSDSWYCITAQCC